MNSVSVADAALVNSYSMITLLANGFDIFFIKGNPLFSNGSKSLPKNPSDYPILCNWAFDNFTLADKPFVKFFRSLQTN